MEIRAERPEDIPGIRQVNIEAFDRVNEANLVDRLREATFTVSFVAIESEQETERIVGHIFYSPVEIVGDDGNPLRSLLPCSPSSSLSFTPPPLLGLAPMAVLPEYQRRGIGSQLIRHSLAECDRLGYKAIVVLGHPEYYPKFGFVPAKEKGLRCEYPVPDEVFMVLELEQGTLEGCSGLIRYRSEFNEVE
ncbi:GNAT family N-acetyltransferase [Leptolyngbya ohadii]|uniref:GNAT family N-acetyltransferase n=1 Tax=Leptolyngbya ohadii TaxID=1962290 RepID=UPI000B5A20A7|nr:N-acetyltransferase [Leptolyngbya ohadii]